MIEEYSMHKVIQSADGYDYRLLETPSSVVLSDVIYQSEGNFTDRYKFHHIYVKAEEIRSKNLPNDANPREPTMGDVVAKMNRTIQDNPDKFHHWNNGMTAVCTGFSYDETTKQVEINFEEGDGICNGGHTYFSIVTQPLEISDTCYVHLELIELPAEISGVDRKKEINDIAAARNRNRQLLPYTQADYLKYYDSFKIALGDKSIYISWHEGDSEAVPSHIKSELFIRLLACVDPFWYKHPSELGGSGNHMRAGTSSQAIHSRWMEGCDPEELDHTKNLYHLAPLGVEILKYRDLVSYSLKHDSFSGASTRLRGTNFFTWLSEKHRELQLEYQGQEGWAVSPPVDVMIMGTMRSNIWLGLDTTSKPRYVGALVDFKTLWDGNKDSLLERLYRHFDSSQQEPLQFIKNGAAYDLQLVEIEYGKHLPLSPLYFYDLEDGTKYVQNEDTPSHYLTISDLNYTELKERKGRKIPKGTFGYSKEI